jgi:hypothetical protein
MFSYATEHANVSKHPAIKKRYLPLRATRHTYVHDRDARDPQAGLESDDIEH